MGDSTDLSHDLIFTIEIVALDQLGRHFSLFQQRQNLVRSSSR
ncbi:hypothetical protein VMF7928_02818 [Vibrio marisflavi CECT 7928]|uniref:Uncharacterized protein n=1 Tax=Vibrio marisflavi CECT 7928 TaxID=634439 RepID=A0ABM9A5E1_9VIBR|nr:hypothetical protein VMF7928_02818 [Vibrio marisflavi CECT 7928]